VLKLGIVDVLQGMYERQRK